MITEIYLIMEMEPQQESAAGAEAWEGTTHNTAGKKVLDMQCIVYYSPEMNL